MPSSLLVAGIELGGTKSVAVLARDAEIIERERIPTDDPASTLDALADQLATWVGDGQQFSKLNALLDRGDTREALVHARRAVTMSPADPGAQDVLRRALASQR